MQEREEFASEMYLRKPVAVGSSEQIGQPLGAETFDSHHWKRRQVI